MFINGINPTIRTPLSIFREKHHRYGMTFAPLIQESQDIWNTLQLQMAQFYAVPVKSTRATTTKVALVPCPSRITLSTLHFHFLEPDTNKVG